VPGATGAKGPGGQESRSAARRKSQVSRVARETGYQDPRDAKDPGGKGAMKPRSQDKESGGKEAKESGGLGA
jgi:hypothetical protein